MNKPYIQEETSARAGTRNVSVRAYRTIPLTEYYIFLADYITNIKNHYNISRIDEIITFIDGDKCCVIHLLEK